MIRYAAIRAATTAAAAHATILVVLSFEGPSSAGWVGTSGGIYSSSSSQIHGGTVVSSSSAASPVVTAVYVENFWAKMWMYPSSTRYPSVVTLSFESSSGRAEISPSWSR